MFLVKTEPYIAHLSVPPSLVYLLCGWGYCNAAFVFVLVMYRGQFFVRLSSLEVWFSPLMEAVECTIVLRNILT